MTDPATTAAPITADAADLTALRTGAGCCAPDLRTLVGLRGGDTLAWLERLCSNPVGELPAGQLVSAVLMDGKGKTRADLRLFRSPLPADPADTRPPEVLMDLPAGPRATLLRLLDMYIIKDDVQLEDHASDLGWLLLAGPGSAEVLAAVGLPAPQADTPSAALAATSPTSPLAAGVHAVLATRRAGVPGFDLLITRGAEDGLLQLLEQHGATRVAPEAIEVQRIVGGVPRFETDLADGVIPLEAHLADHVSTTKGCYPGQEVVARITNLGSVARKLVRLSAPGRVAVTGVELLGTGDLAGKPAGTLSSVAYDPLDDRTVALAYVRRASWKTGSQVLAGETRFDVTALND